MLLADGERLRRFGHALLGDGALFALARQFTLKLRRLAAPDAGGDAVPAVGAPGDEAAGQEAQDERRQHGHIERHGDLERQRPEGEIDGTPVGHREGHDDQGDRNGDDPGQVTHGLPRALESRWDGLWRKAFA